MAAADCETVEIDNTRMQSNKHSQRTRHLKNEKTFRQNICSLPNIIDFCKSTNATMKIQCAVCPPVREIKG